MLKSISCEAIVKTPITFGEGLNSVVGADDAQNSIGKSSVLMLIDFAFGGNDFPVKCDDVTRNVGDFKVGIEFEFDKKHSFIRDTSKPDSVYFVEDQEMKTLKYFTSFLKEKYLPDELDISFRECVSGFFRIYQRNNYDDKRPLDIVKKDNWDSIRKRILKIYGEYWKISNLESEKSEKTKRSSDIKGTFGSGAVRKITKTQYTKNNAYIDHMTSEIEAIKHSLRKNVTDIKSLINDRNISLKKEKDELLEKRNSLSVQLARIDSNLNGSKIRKSKSFQVVTEFFPDIDSERLERVEEFHKGITKILKNHLNAEKKLILESISAADSDIERLDKELLKIVDSKEESVYLLERLMELDRSNRELITQNEYWSRADKVKEEIRQIKEEINKAIESSISKIEQSLNSGMKVYIERIYHDKAILPTLSLDSTDYKFSHGDDRGTGKGFANMIALDLTFLEKTHLPCIIHDSLLFKNLDIPAVESLIEIYSGFKKQIFISIDEVSKYREEVRDLIQSSEFIKLDKEKLAFKVKWKSRQD
ncbi:DUF2326 domain-containing protein [Aestuariicella hydrocarbonica]|uniref:DUF2326 domain-containing protein n=1 Tax=Pseudomaricurvus hydrocarbonicus TaxID=1470433 RepID=A0A9E5MMP1_9GAMM|nr:DUF2326 domain-containing protein [Aestuariicella hydrocarbonica]NHO67040.1 DUF2326 domain-containing protein [Aestuariicella hydrocarbonica]